MTVRRHPFRLSAYVLPLLFAMPISALAVDEPARVKGDGSRIEIAAFGELPVRFNVV